MPVTLPEPGAPEVIDIPNDDGSGVAVLWRWVGVTSDTTELSVQVKADPAWLDEFRLTDAQAERVKAAGAALQQGLAALAPEQEAAAKAVGEAQVAFMEADTTKAANLPAARKTLWEAKAKAAALDEQEDHLRNAYTDRTAKLGEKARQFEYLEAALQAAQANGGWLDTTVGGAAAEVTDTKGDAVNRFGLHPADKDKLYQEVKALALPMPAGLTKGELDPYGQPATGRLTVPLSPGRMYELQMVVKDGAAQQATPLGSARARVNLVITTAANNFVLAVLFTLILLLAINMARKNPNLFIRRIAGLEAVDEAIGRATEMGKPVMYLNGRAGLDDLATLAAVNILGRVAGRVAEFDSALLVPCMDPVVMSVAQEVVREGFIDAGRPDAYRQDNIYFVTADQFAYTAAVCATMIRERPAANFLMGNFAAEALLLAETGASTGAIQIAGTDQQSQLPFFITACDYTLIGEELYAASAYLSREPLLLGSLKGQDAAKAVMMLLILVQTLLFAINHDWSWLKDAAKPLF
jgi:hypothetical protein